MTDPMLTLSTAALGGLAMVTSAGLAGWRGWLQLKRTELEQLRTMAGTAVGGAIGGAGTRIELADLRERIRKLEAIAAGVEL
ncbi:hypothetical protein [Sphingomonas sp.]|uniref:hypothetical protein n=1 Tax=Sphingomonas sp. TaxID=28214 RepID=UPI003CC5F87E